MKNRQCKWISVLLAVILTLGCTFSAMAQDAVDVILTTGTTQAFTDEAVS